MKNLHTYFKVSVETPIGDYNDYIDAIKKQYMKENDIIFKHIRFEDNREEYFKQQSERFALRDKVIELLLEEFSEVAFDYYKQCSTYQRKDIMNEIRKKHRNKIKNAIINEFHPKDNANYPFLIKMELFKKFIQKYADCPYLNWSEISSKKFYDWDKECIIIGRNILDIDKLTENTTTIKILLSLTGDEKNLFNINFDNLSKKAKKDTSLFVIKEYEGVLRDYFLIERLFEETIRKNLPFISKIVWLASYSTNQDFLKQEELELELSEANYIYSFEDIEDTSKTISNIALNYAKKNALKVYTNWMDIKPH